MMQSDFVVEVFTKMREQGVHTCIETSGFASQDVYRRVASLTDLFLVDYKIDDPETHKRYTGLDNIPVRRTLELLCEFNAEVVLRAIIIPGVNDCASHLSALAQMQKQMPNISGIDIMAFHHYGSGKYVDMGLAIPELYSADVTSEMVERWITTVREAGGRNVKKG